MENKAEKVRQIISEIYDDLAKFEVRYDEFVVNDKTFKVKYDDGGFLYIEHWDIYENDKLIYSNENPLYVYLKLWELIYN